MKKRLSKSLLSLLLAAALLFSVLPMKASAVAADTAAEADAATLSVGEGEFGYDLDQSEADEDGSVPDPFFIPIYALEDELLPEEPVEEDFIDIMDEVAELVQTIPGYVEGTLSVSDDTLYWKASDGTPYAYMPQFRIQDRPDEKAGLVLESTSEVYDYSGEEEIHMSGEDVDIKPVTFKNDLAPTGGSVDLAGTGDNYLGPTSRNISVLEPQYGFLDTHSTDFNVDGRPIEDKGKKLAKYTGGECFINSGKYVTIDKIVDSLKYCGVVIIHTHGGASSFEIRSGEGLSKYSTWWKTGDNIWTINGKTIAEGLGNYVCPNNLFIIGACHCMETDNFSSNLIPQGVGAIFGFSYSINHYGDLTYLKALCERLDDGRKLGDAVARMKRDKGYFDPHYFDLRSYDAAVAEFFGSSTDFSGLEDLYKIYSKYPYHNINENTTVENSPWAKYCQDFVKKRYPHLDSNNWRSWKLVSDAIKKVLNDYPNKKKYSLPVLVSEADPYPDDPYSVQDTNSQWRLPKKSESFSYDSIMYEEVHTTKILDVDRVNNNKDITFSVPDMSDKGYYVQSIAVKDTYRLPKNVLYWSNIGNSKRPVLKVRDGFMVTKGLCGVEFQVRYWNYMENKYIYKMVYYHILFFKEDTKTYESTFTINADPSKEQIIPFNDSKLRSQNAEYFKTIQDSGNKDAGMHLYGGCIESDDWYGFSNDTAESPYLKGVTAVPGNYESWYYTYDTAGNKRTYKVTLTVKAKRTVYDSLTVKMTGGSLNKYPIKVQVDGKDQTNSIVRAKLHDDENNKLPAGIDIVEDNGKYYLNGKPDKYEAGKKHNFTLDVMLKDCVVVELRVYLIEPCHVVFDLNGHGVNAPQDQWIQVDGCVQKPADPVVSGYKFCGWYTDKACTDQYYFDTVLDGAYLSFVDSSLNLYAKWEKSQIVYLYGMKNSAVIPEIYELDKITVGQFDHLTKNGYTFKGWQALGNSTVFPKLNDCLGAQIPKQGTFKAWAVFYMNPTEIVPKLPDSVKPGDVIDLKAILQPWKARADLSWSCSSSDVTIRDGKLYVSDSAATYSEIEVIATDGRITGKANVTIIPKEKTLTFISGDYTYTFDVTEENPDILGDGVFSYDGERTLTISGDSAIVDGYSIECNFDDGLDIIVEGDVTMIAYNRPALTCYGDATIRGGGALHLECAENGTTEEMLSVVGSNIELNIMDVTLTCSGNARGISCFKGKPALIISNADLDINSGSECAILGFSGGIELVDCELDGGDGVIVGSDGVYKSADEPASHVVIKATGAQRMNLSGTVTYPSGEPMFNALVKIGDQIVMTDSLGRYTLHDVPAGQYVVEISDISGNTVEQTVEFDPSQASVDPENPQHAEPTASVDIKPYKTYTVTFVPGDGEGEAFTAEVGEGAEIELPECDFTAPTGMVFDAWEIGYPGDYAQITGNVEVAALYKSNGHVHTMQFIEGTDPDCEHGGTFNAYYCEECGKYFLTGDGSLEISSSRSIGPLGHVWEFVDWTWADDYSTAWANFVCSSDEEHTLSIEADNVMHFDVTEIMTEYSDTIVSMVDHIATITVQGQYHEDIVQEVIPVNCAVDFDLSGHGTAEGTLDEPTMVVNGSKVARPADPSEDGWTFEGWYADPDCTVPFDFNAPIVNNTIVYSKWTQNDVGFMIGDADGDGEVTILDATFIQRYLASLPTESFDEKAADADEDKEITILDATAIQRHLAGLPTNERIGTLI